MCKRCGNRVEGQASERYGTVLPEPPSSQAERIVPSCRNRELRNRQCLCGFGALSRMCPKCRTKKITNRVHQGLRDANAFAILKKSARGIVVVCTRGKKLSPCGKSWHL